MIYCQMLFAGVLPEILELLGQRSKWMGSYCVIKGRRYPVSSIDSLIVSSERGLFTLTSSNCDLEVDILISYDRRYKIVLQLI